MEQLDYDLIIVGGGAVGITLALQLQLQGYRIAIIESSALNYRLSDPERMIALSYGSKNHLQRIGAWSHLLDNHAGRIRHIDVFDSTEGSRIALHNHDLQTNNRSFADALGYVVDMSILNQELHTLAQKSGIQWFTQSRVLQVDTLATHIALQTDRNGVLQTMTTALVVGADGTHSAIRKMAGISTRGWDYNRFGLVCSVQVELGHFDVAYECFKSSGPLALLPMGDGRYSVVWAMEPREAAIIASLSPTLFLKKLNQALGMQVIEKTGRVMDVGARFCFPLELRIAKQFVAPRIALVGNAAHTIHPVAGQGMNLGLRDVEALANTLSVAHASQQNPGDATLLKTYADQRILDTLAVAGFTEAMVQGFSFEGALASQTRQWIMDRIHGSSSLKKLLIQHAAGVAQMSSQPHSMQS
ncbi:MAG: FAD-dependent monooxygenase [Zetaproteobacteria bacterium]|nr:FAD-dependent monooxygenase [Zetaproteobacteria bacterium]